jgi:hypothetical protein
MTLVQCSTSRGSMGTSTLRCRTMVAISLRTRIMEMSGRGGSSILESCGGRAEVERGRRVWVGELLQLKHRVQRGRNR